MRPTGLCVSPSVRIKRIRLFPALEDRFELTAFYQRLHTVIEQGHQATRLWGLGKAKVQRQLGEMGTAQPGGIFGHARPGPANAGRARCGSAL